MSNPIWNYLEDRGQGNTCDFTLVNSVQVANPLWVDGNACLQNTSSITKGPLVVKGQLTLASASRNYVGTSSNPISEADIAGGCKLYTYALHALCSSADNVWASIYSTSVPAYSAPVPDWDFWYSHSSPGPSSGCDSSSVLGTPPQFDNNGTRDNSLSTIVNLTPSASYHCAVASTGGELSWDATAHVLTVTGTIFIDGSATIQNGLVNSYSGEGTIYLSGTLLLKNSSLCAAVYNGACDMRTGQWDPNSKLLAFITNGSGGQNTGSIGTQLTSFTLQGAAYATYDLNIGTTANLDGPMNARTIAFGQSVTSTFPSLTTVPAGLPGEPNVVAPTSASTPRITGWTQVGQTLTVSPGDWENSPTSYFYTWEECDANGANCTDLPGSWASYTILSQDAGGTVRVRVTAQNAAGQAEASALAPIVVAQPTIAYPASSSSYNESNLLSPDVGKWTNQPATYSYQWDRCDVDGNNCSDILGATASTYRPLAIDYGRKLKIIVHATNALGSSSTESVPTDPVGDEIRSIQKFGMYYACSVVATASNCFAGSADTNNPITGIRATLEVGADSFAPDSLTCLLFRINVESLSQLFQVGIEGCNGVGVDTDHSDSCNTGAIRSGERFFMSESAVDFAQPYACTAQYEPHPQVQNGQPYDLQITREEDGTTWQAEIDGSPVAEFQFSATDAPSSFSAGAEHVYDPNHYTATCSGWSGEAVYTDLEFRDGSNIWHDAPVDGLPGDDFYLNKGCWQISGDPSDYTISN